MKLRKKQENNADLRLLRPRRQKIEVKISLPLTYEEKLFGFFKRYAEENRLSFNGLLAPYLTKVGIHGFVTARSCRLTTKTSNALIEFGKSKGWIPPNDTPIQDKIVEAQAVCDDFARLIERYGMEAVKNGLNNLDSFLFEQCLRSK